MPLILERKASSGEPVKVLVYDSVLHYVCDVSKKFGIQSAAFFTHCATTCTIFYQLHDGTLKSPLQDEPAETISLSSVPCELKPKDLPSLIYDPGSYPSLLRATLNQSLNFHHADWIFLNSFDSLELQAVSWMASYCPNVKTIGPTIPSIYLDKSLKDDKDYGLSLFNPETHACKQWLDTKAKGAVAYASFGSMASLSGEQMEEIAWGFANSRCYFLWVVRASEESKLPKNFAAQVGEKGLIVKWCSQLEVLAHDAVGCFLTHCGWNSTVEALSLGVPMVVLPQWNDQPTNAKLIVDVWQTGLRLEAGEDGIVRRDEVEIGIREAIVGDGAVELKKNAAKWKDLAKEAMSEGGSSYKNIEQFVSSIGTK
ncbi:OLC1v1012854C1 [Oldenlandia corymbosa var. corymbosa]|uniref:OLC1v1012854C1 n=1 Tax=Oldenlandia corymbosa var. corymbosa TaxID=529605 RepID=A0AAV1DWZ0_OLDCO|nr:OLC1v1012854C1 [Oldenlandia corymbosa var. corymbosa]